MRSQAPLLVVDAALPWAAAVEVPADVTRTALLWYGGVAALAVAVLLAVALLRWRGR